MSFTLPRKSALLICASSCCCSYLISQTSEEPAQKVPFCTLLREPETYKDTLITLRVRVTSFRHGTLVSESHPLTARSAAFAERDCPQLEQNCAPAWVYLPHAEHRTDTG